MYSVKPGRGPSLMGGIGGIFAAIFGVIWTIGAMSMGAPPFFALFGIVFVLAAVSGAVYNFYNATGQDRMSTLDVTTDAEEGDPIAQAMGYQQRSDSGEQVEGQDGPRRYPGEFCPFCGAKVGGDFDYCPKCGKNI
jgi:hypothetical protein